MKKSILAIGGLIVLLTVYLVFSDSDKPVTNYPSSGTTIVAFGDSLVAGSGSTEGGDFVSELSRQVEVPIINLGKNGDTTRDALIRLDEVLENNPKIVLLLFGGNDYLKKIPEEETFSNLEKIVEAIHESGSSVILLGIRGGVLKDNYKENFEKLSKEYRTAHVPDVLDGLLGHADLMSDTVHPNDAGYKIIANRIYPVLNNLLE